LFFPGIIIAVELLAFFVGDQTFLRRATALFAGRNLTAFFISPFAGRLLTDGFTGLPALRQTTTGLFVFDTG